MIIEKAAATAGIEMDGDVLARGNRTQKHFKRLIHAVRAAEAAQQEESRSLNEDVRRTLRENLQLRDQNEKLRAELYSLRLKQKVDELHLTPEASTNLLAVAV